MAKVHIDDFWPTLHGVTTQRTSNWILLSGLYFSF